ncbi:MAG: hypothetical protein JKY15_03310 [Deltaproteobacteria bacterium]|nr:hypothetical protein [Deltaproteobacteria bacterium]
MRIALLFVMLVLGCQKSGPDSSVSLEGKTLKGTVTSATGIFAGQEGYQFSTVFMGPNTFETRSANGKVESVGQYAFHKGQLMLQSTGGLHSDEGLEIELKFTDPKSGVYEAHSLLGANGEQTGIFTLQ